MQQSDGLHGKSRYKCMLLLRLTRQPVTRAWAPVQIILAWFERSRTHHFGTENDRERRLETSFSPLRSCSLSLD